MPFHSMIGKARGKSTNRKQGRRKEKYLAHGKTRGLPATLAHELQGRFNARSQHAALWFMVRCGLRQLRQLNLLANLIYWPRGFARRVAGALSGSSGQGCLGYRPRISLLTSL